MNPLPGDHVKINVNGQTYDTVIDDRGVQRFVQDPNNQLAKTLSSTYADFGTGSEDMNAMRYRYMKGEWDQQTYLAMHAAIGYSVDSCLSMSVFEDMLVINPLWMD
jgi:hypothetical protein